MNGVTLCYGWECDFRVSIKFGNKMFMKLIHE
jgi:hypothetical protein